MEQRSAAADLWDVQLLRSVIELPARPSNSLMAMLVQVSVLGLGGFGQFGPANSGRNFGEI